MKNVIAAVLLIGSPMVAGAVGSIASINAPSFYQGLNLPRWAPPAWLFGPVWIALYLMMGIAAFLVWRKRGAAARSILALFLVHLVFNAAWSWFFFAWRLGALSIADILLLWILIVMITIGFFRINKPAGWLFIPYLAWVTFATTLNISVVISNPNAFNARFLDSQMAVATA